MDRFINYSQILERLEINKHRHSVSRAFLKGTESNFKKKNNVSIHPRVVLIITSLLAGFMVFPGSLVPSSGKKQV